MSNTLDKKQVIDLKSQAASLDPLINIGKSGVTESVIEEIRKQLKDRKLVKIRVLRNADESEDLKGTAQELAETCSAELIDVRGKTIVLYRR